MHAGRKVQGMNHTGPCRIRIEGHLKDDQDPRIAANAARLNEEVARRLEVREGAIVTGASATSPIAGATTTTGDTISGTIDDNIGDGQPDAQYPNGPCGSEALAVANDYNGTRRALKPRM